MRLPGRRLAAAPVLALALALALAPGGAAAKGRALIRDAEIETTIRDLAAPLLAAAGLAPGAVGIHIVHDDSLNAFVAGGQNLFLHTGLLARTETPGQLAGVLAHEIGHIAGGHLARTSAAMRDASTATIVGTVLAGAAAAAAGRADAGAAILHGAAGAARAAMLGYTRTQEAAADQAAVRLLDATGQSARGLAAFLRVLEGQELLSVSRRSAYAITHPLTRERIAFVESHLAVSPFRDATPPPDRVERHARMAAKLAGFLEPPARVLRRYPPEDASVAARYARAIAAFREPAPDRALDLLDALIGERPGDGYFRELRGQILFESGRPAEARAAYLRALDLLGPEPTVEGELARVELALNTEESNAAARGRLERVVRAGPPSGRVWRNLAIAQGRTGDTAMAALSLAEEALLAGRPADAARQADRARRALPPGSPAARRAADIDGLARRRLARRR